MTEPDRLRLAAVDDEDLAVLSAHVQDAVLKVGDLIYLPSEKRFALAMNRFSWEKANAVTGRKRDGFERRRTALTFDRVTAVRATGVDRGRPETVLELLALSFAVTDAPSGVVTLVFAGGGAVELSVEVIEARLADLGPAWGTTSKPSHDAAAG
jgi:hypothetical protein